MLPTRALFGTIALAGLLAMSATTLAHAVARLGPINASGGAGATLDIPVGFTSSENITCLQFDVLFDPARVTLGAARTGSAAPGHRIESRLLATGRHRVVIYSTTLAPLNGGYIVQLPVTWSAAGDSALAVNSVFLANTEGTAVAFTSSSLAPEIVANGSGNQATAGSSNTLAVEATAGSGVTYQWSFNGEVLPGATSATLSLPNTQPFNAGTYSVVISANGLTLNSQSFTLNVQPPAPNDGRLLNLSTRGLAQTGDNVLIPGFVVSGIGTKRLLIRAVGPTLGQPPFNLAGVLPDPRMRLLKRNAVTTQFEEIATNDNWGTNSNAADITTTAAGLFAFSFKDDLESALLLDVAPGEYTVIAGGGNDATGIAIVELYDADDTADARLINISNRGFCGVGDQVMIPGFVVSTEGPKTFLIRVVGPKLADFGVSGTMVDPKLEIYPGGGTTPILANDNWGDNPAAAHTATVATQLSAFSLAAGSKDAAFVVTLPPGSYTVVGSSAVAGGTGVVLVEVYVVP